MIKIPQPISKYFPKKDRFIGLDMGSSSLKLVEFIRQEGKLTPRKFKIQEIDLREDTQKAQLDALKKLFQGIDTQEAKINVVVNCAQSCTRILTLPYMPKSEILEAVKWEMKNFISFSIEEAVLDYEIIQEVSEGGVKKLKVCVACSPQKTINGYLDLLNQAGIQPNLFTQGGFALKNIIAGLCPQDNKTIAVLDIGANLCELFIFADNQLSFSRKLPVAGGDFTKGITQVLVSELGKLQLNLQEAEEVKRKYGIPDAGTSRVLEDKIFTSQLFSLLRPNLEKLAEEIGRSFDFYREKEQGAGLERLILLGGGSSLKNLAKNLAQELDIPVELGNPLPDQKIESAHRFAQAIGVGLSPQDRPNLLPVEIKEKTRLLIERSSIKAIAAAVLVILILTFIGMKVRLGVYDKRIAAAKLEIAALLIQNEALQKQASLAYVLQQRIYWSDTLKEISNRTPAQVRLTAINAQQKALILKGEIKSPALAEEKVLTLFMNSLGEGIFKQVNLVSTKKGLSADEPYIFELRLRLE